LSKKPITKLTLFLHCILKTTRKYINTKFGSNLKIQQACLKYLSGTLMLGFFEKFNG